MWVRFPLEAQDQKYIVCYNSTMAQTEFAQRFPIPQTLKSYDAFTREPTKALMDLIESIQLLGGDRGKILNAFLEQGLIQHIDYDPSTWGSELSQEAPFRLRLGIQPLPQEIKAKVMYLEQNFSYSDELMYRFMHEVCHGIIYILILEKLLPLQGGKSTAGKIWADFTSATQLDGKSLTGLPRLSIYQAMGPFSQGLEDTVELTNMCLWSTEYFRSYVLTFLNKNVPFPTCDQEAAKIGLRLLPQEEAQETFARIQQIVTDIKQMLLI